MNTATIEYKKRVWDYLERMKPGQRISISKICVAESRPVFISCIKEWMHGKPFQGYVTFNADYSEIYKTEEIIFKK